MKRNSAEREIEAIDSEFQNFKNDDSTRKYQIILKELIIQDHPLGKFMFGNKQSLNQTDSVEILHKWYKKNYSSEWMNLVLLSPHSLDDLETIAKDKFEKIENLGLRTPPDEPDYSKKGFIDNISRIIRYVPLEHSNEIDIIFPLPSEWRDGKRSHRCKGSHYLAWLIDHEGKGSIIARLRDKNWAHYISAGSQGHGRQENGFTTNFKINIRLTESGLENWKYIINIVFKYIEMLNKISETEEIRIFKEIQKIENLNWNSKEEYNPLG